MSWIAVGCFGICVGIVLSILRRGTDPLSPARVYGFVWAFAVGLAELKLSAFQHEWSGEGWVVLLVGIGSFLAGTFIAYVLNFSKAMVPIPAMRAAVRAEEVHERRLFWLIAAGVGVYSVGFVLNYMIRGFLPIFDLNRSRIEFNVTGVTLFLFSVPYILFFIMLYFFLVRGRRGSKAALVVMAVVTVGSTLLLLSRFQLFMPIVVCSAFLYYGSRFIQWRTVLPLVLGMSGLLFGVSSLRTSHLVVSFIYYASRMRFPREYAFFTEPYMYIAMNLENLARTVRQLDYHTFGWLSFDFVTAAVGLKYPLMEYFGFERHPFLNSGYNTYPSLWWFYMDFGVIGTMLIPLALGLCTGVAYYRMRQDPSVKRVAAYAVWFFVAFVSTYTYPPSMLWFIMNVLVMSLGLSWVMKPTQTPERAVPAPAAPGWGEVDLLPGQSPR